MRNWLSRIGRAAVSIGTRHAWDLVAGAGLVMTFVGLWWLLPAAALITVGPLLLLLGLWGARAEAWKGRKKRKVVEDEA